MHRLKFLTPLIILIALVAVGCSDGNTKSSRTETQNTDKSIDRLITSTPAHTCSNCPTRKTINFWIDTWNVPGQLAFTYIRTDAGDDNGYYVLDGPPVSMCAALTKTWTYEGTPKDGDGVLDQKVPRRSLDGVYYSGGQCSSYYGKDASSGAYIEFSIGAGQNYFLSTQPLPKVSTKALGPTDASMVTCGDPGQTDKPVCAIK